MKTIYILIISLSFAGCTSNFNDNTTENNNKTMARSTTDAPSKKIDTSFFLGFKSDFSEEQFKKQIRLENEKGTMQNNTFSISIDFWVNKQDGSGHLNTEVLDFIPSLNNGQLFLEYSEINTRRTLNNLTRGFSNYFENYQIISDSLFNLFKSKYEFKGYLEPSKKRQERDQIFHHATHLIPQIKEMFQKRNLTQTTYAVFQNRHKTILLGTTFIGHKNETGLNEVYEQLETEKRRSMYEYKIALEVFEASLMAYRSLSIINQNATFIPQKYIVSESSNPFRIGDPELHRKITVQHNNIALLINDIERLKAYEKDYLQYFFDCQIIYMLNTRFKTFASDLSKDYTNLVQPYFDKSNAQSVEYQNKVKQTESNKHEL